MFLMNVPFSLSKVYQANPAGMIFLRSLTGIILLYLSTAVVSASCPDFKNTKDTDTPYEWLNPEKDFAHVFHQDSIHRIDFRYADKKRGLKPFTAPALLIAAGTTTHFMPELKHNFREYMQENFAYKGGLDHYIPYAPLAAVYVLNLTGIRGKNNPGNVSALAAKSFILSSLIIYPVKTLVDETRPNQEGLSFPSGHTTRAFAFAQLMHREYEEQSIWYSIAAYSCAGTAGILRMAKDAHWLPDVLAGAGIGILSTELIYLTHQYKWDNDHIRRFDIFPFQSGRQKGLTLVCTF